MTNRYLTTLLPNSSGSLNVVLSGSNNLAWTEGGGYLTLFCGGRIIELSGDRTNTPAIDGSYIAWEDDFNKLKLFDGERTILIKKAVVSISEVDINGDRLLWVDGTGAGNNEIYYYNGDRITRLTRNNVNDNSPQLSGNYGVWDSQGKIHLKSLMGGEETIISEGSFNSDAQIDGKYVTWVGSDSPTGLAPLVQLYNINTESRITLNKDIHVPGTSTLDARISGEHVVWVGSDGNDLEIYLYNIATKERTQLTKNTSDDDQVELSGDTVVWRRKDGGDTEIYAYSISTGETTRLTRNSTDERDPVVSGTNIAWVGEEGASLATLTTLSETSATLANDVGNLELTGTASVNGTGNNSNNVLAGNRADNRLSGLKGDDQLVGNGGDDTLVGGEGVDLLSGNGGGDRFLFDLGRRFTEALGVDQVTDFKRSEGDKLVLDSTTFAALGRRVDFASVANESQARTSSAHITYVASTGDLFYNQNGAAAGFGSGEQIADFKNGLILGESDFVVIG